MVVHNSTQRRKNPDRVLQCHLVLRYFASWIQNEDGNKWDVINTEESEISWQGIEIAMQNFAKKQATSVTV